MWEKVHSLRLIYKFVSQVFPLVNTELSYWHSYAQAYAEKELSLQALASIEHKRFHCLGGGIYSLYQNVDMPSFIRLTTALQTISDYLDNLCDRTPFPNEQAFRQLHLAMTDALHTDGILQDYYKFYSFKQDGNYLNSLVLTCQQEVSKLSAYSVVKSDILKLASWYSELQIYKHLEPALRRKKMDSWAKEQLTHYDDILFWEFAAAAGSTLGIFVLLAAANKPSLSQQESSQLFLAYFPWICGLHILLDYFIDREEDTVCGDLNFTTYYTDNSEMMSRLMLFINHAASKAGTLPQPVFNQTVVYGMLAMYLSDPKALSPKEKPITKKLLNYAGSYTKILQLLCLLLRRYKKI